MIMEIYPELIEEFETSLIGFVNKESLEYILDESNGFFSIYIKSNIDSIQDLECAVYAILAKMKQDGYDIESVKDVYFVKLPETIEVKFV